MLEAEGLALFHGLKLFYRKGIDKTQVEVDFVVLVHQIHFDFLGKWPHCNTLSYMHILI